MTEVGGAQGLEEEAEASHSRVHWRGVCFLLHPQAAWPFTWSSRGVSGLWSRDGTSPARSPGAHAHCRHSPALARSQPFPGDQGPRGAARVPAAAKTRALTI